MCVESEHVGAFFPAGNRVTAYSGVRPRLGTMFDLQTNFLSDECTTAHPTHHIIYT